MILLKESHLLESLFSRGKLKNARVMKMDCEFGESTCIVLILFVQKLDECSQARLLILSFVTQPMFAKSRVIAKGHSIQQYTS